MPMASEFLSRCAEQVMKWTPGDSQTQIVDNLYALLLKAVKHETLSRLLVKVIGGVRLPVHQLNQALLGIVSQVIAGNVHGSALSKVIKPLSANGVVPWDAI